jgi:hypothetical protein
MRFPGERKNEVPGFFDLETPDFNSFSSKIQKHSSLKTKTKDQNVSKKSFQDIIYFFT